MKRVVLFWLFVLAALFLVSACSAAPTSLAVQLPAELVTVIGFFVLVAITAVFKWFGDKLGGIDLSDRAAEVAAAVSAVIVLAINYGLGLVPAAYDNFISALFSFLIVFLGGAGAFSLFFRKKIRTAVSFKASDALPGLIEGRIVHYVLSEGPSKGEHRPAVIVRVWNKQGTCNLQVITDSDPEGKYNDHADQLLWKTSITFDPTGKQGTWHWVEPA